VRRKRVSGDVHALGTRMLTGAAAARRRAGALAERGAQEKQSAASAAMARARCAPMSAPAKAAAPRAGPPATSPIAIASRAPSCGVHSGREQQSGVQGLAQTRAVRAA